MRLALYVALERTVLLTQWEERACECAPARQLSAEALREPVDALLVGVVAELQHASAAAANLEAARRALDAAGHDHAHQRLRAQFTVEQIVNEYVLLRGVVLRGWLVDGSRLDAPSGEDLTNFNAALDRLVVAAITTGLAEFDRARELLIGTLGHDLRNPLGALASNASLLARLLPKHAPAMDAVLRIERNTARMGRLIALLLDRTRLRLGAGLQVERKLMDAGEACRQTTEELQSLHPDREIVVRASGDLTGAWDADRILQLMSNLIGNALKYGAREAAVIVTLTSTTDSVRISVQNVGAPIPMDRRGSLFEPMVQGRPSDVDASGAFRGLGLGLYIAREVVVAHGGTLDVDSDAVNGTTFTAVLPRC